MRLMRKSTIADSCRKGNTIENHKPIQHRTQQACIHTIHLYTTPVPRQSQEVRGALPERHGRQCPAGSAGLVAGGHLQHQGATQGGDPGRCAALPATGACSAVAGPSPAGILRPQQAAWPVPWLPCAACTDSRFTYCIVLQRETRLLAALEPVCHSGGVQSSCRQIRCLFVLIALNVIAHTHLKPMTSRMRWSMRCRTCTAISWRSPSSVGASATAAPSSPPSGSTVCSGACGSLATAASTPAQKGPISAKPAWSLCCTQWAQQDKQHWGEPDGIARLY